VKPIDLRIADSDNGMERAAVPDDRIDLGTLLSAMRRQRRFVALWAMLGAAAAFAYISVTPKSYRAEATIMLGSGNRPGMDAMSAFNSGMALETAMEGALEVMRSQRLSLAVADKLALWTDPRFLNPPSSPLKDALAVARHEVQATLLHVVGSPAPEVDGPEVAAERPLTPEEHRLAAAAQLQNGIEIARRGRSTVFTLGYETHDPELAADIANAYAAAYITDILSANLEATETTIGWMQRRLEELNQEAQQARLEAERFRARSGALVGRGTLLSEEGMVATAQLQALEQRADSLATLYEALLSQTQQLENQRDLPVAGVRVLSDARAPDGSSAPRTSLLLLGLTLLGATVGTALAARREYQEVFIRSGDQVRKDLGQRFLGYIPSVRGVRDRYVKRTRRGEPRPANPELVLQTLVAPKSPFTQTLRNVRVMAAAHAPGKERRILGVTSIRPGEGKTTVAVNLAGLIAASAKPTLLIDCDALNPTLSRRLNAREVAPSIFRSSGKDEKWHESLIITANPALHILPLTGTGKGQDDTAVLEDIQAILKDAAKEYAQIILDLPPVGLIADAKLMLPLVDSILLVTEWGRTPKHLLADTLATEPALVRKLLGVVINRTHMRKLRAFTPTNSIDTYYYGPN
jgi:uncharacterized protein involved in exopolysaccharide biosynthesis/Mrp family chromosome partitioning ATPase